MEGFGGERGGDEKKGGKDCDRGQEGGERKGDKREKKIEVKKDSIDGERGFEGRNEVSEGNEEGMGI